MTTSNTMGETSQNATLSSQEEKGPEPSSSSSSSHNVTGEIESDSLNGYQSLILVFAISLAGFLYTLDISIIVTVSLVVSLYT